MSLLHDLGIKYHTDKAYDHNFMRFYEKFFEPIRFEVKNLLEIGVWGGASIKVWLEYFPNAQIYGVDTAPKPSVEQHERFTFITKNAFDTDVTSMFGTDFFDIVIDDGSHRMTEQRRSLKTYWPKIKPNGMFVMEDMHTSFWSEYVDVKPTTYEFLVDKLDTDDVELNTIRNQVKTFHLFHTPDHQRIRDSHITSILVK